MSTSRRGSSRRARGPSSRGAASEACGKRRGDPSPLQGPSGGRAACVTGQVTLLPWLWASGARVPHSQEKTVVPALADEGRWCRVGLGQAAVHPASGPTLRQAQPSAGGPSRSQIPVPLACSLAGRHLALGPSGPPALHPPSCALGPHLPPPSLHRAPSPRSPATARPHPPLPGAECSVHTWHQTWREHLRRVLWGAPSVVSFLFLFFLTQQSSLFLAQPASWADIQVSDPLSLPLFGTLGSFRLALSRPWVAEWRALLRLT